MSENTEHLPPPQSPEDFESVCLHLWRKLWGDANAQKNGRSGQPQAGVDVFGRHAGRQIGVQCKQKDALLRTKVTVADLEEEVEKAKTFKPPLASFILATTGLGDAKLQEHARELAARVGFEVTIWCWDDIKAALFANIELLDRIFALYWPTLARLAKLPPQKLAASRLPRGAPQLFGRDAELARLDAAWHDEKTRIVTIVAWGGTGKSALVGKWVAGLADRKFNGADYFDWSFYSQGTRDHSTASADAFVDAALRFFGDPATADSTQGAWDKGARLAELVGRRRALLVLDGLEPLQHNPTSPLAGELKDPAINALLRGLAARNLGLCVLTTRVHLPDLDNWRDGGAPEWSLEKLLTPAGVALLGSLGVRGAKADIERLVVDVKGHALTLNLLGTYLRDAHSGDVRRRDLVSLGEADAEAGEHAFQVMAAYERFFEAEGEKGLRQLTVLRLLGLFDRPASAECLATLRQAPAIPGLTEQLFHHEKGWRGWFRQPAPIAESIWQSSLSHLARSSLVDLQDGALDAHPLIREYFGQQLRERKAAAWRAAHGRLFDHLKESTEHQPASLTGLQPLYQAVYHGCQADRHEEARAEVYRDRISRGREVFAVKKLGAFGADLGAVACFFETPWIHVTPSLAEADQAWLLNEVAFRLRALGRLREAVEPMWATLKINSRAQEWENCAAVAGNLSDVELTLGDVKAAVKGAEQAVVFADRSGDAFQRMGDRTTLAAARHQAGEIDAALALFREAERLQAEWQRQYPLLYSLQGFRFCDFLLAPAEAAAQSGRNTDVSGAEKACAEVEQRATQTLEWAMQHLDPLDVALDHLSIGRARLYRAILDGHASQAPTETRTEVDKAVAGLRAAGTMDYLPRGLLTRAWLRHFEGDPDGARADLDEAQEIAERGSMKLHLADVALYRARLFDDREALATAKRLVEECGYGRRRPEIAELEARLGPV